MEFVNKSDVLDVLQEHGYQEIEDGDRVRLVMPDDGDAVHLQFGVGTDATEPRKGARIIETPAEDLAGIIEQIVHRLGLSDVLLFPVGKWRRIFDAVAFSLASNESWQEFDAAATVELNTRDPIICESVDFPLLIDLVRALVSDGETAEQALVVIATGQPVLAEILPDGVVRVSVGNQVLADRIVSAVGV